jgi:hypothetical protein
MNYPSQYYYSHLLLILTLTLRTEVLDGFFVKIERV